MITTTPIDGKRNPVSRITSRVTPRGWTLLFVGGFISAARGLFYFTSVDDAQVPVYLQYVTNLAPVSVYGVIWTLIGLFCASTVLASFSSRLYEFTHRKMLPIAIGLLVGINSLWALSFAIGQFVGGASDSIWLTGLSYAGFAMFFWYMGTSIDVEEVA